MAYEEYFPECCYGANEFPQISMMCIKEKLPEVENDKAAQG